MAYLSTEQAESEQAYRNYSNQHFHQLLLFWSVKRAEDQANDVASLTRKGKRRRQNQVFAHTARLIPDVSVFPSRFNSLFQTAEGGKDHAAYEQIAPIRL